MAKKTYLADETATPGFYCRVRKKGMTFFLLEGVFFAPATPTSRPLVPRSFLFRLVDSVPTNSFFFQVTITGFDLTSYRQCLTKWNSAIQSMYEQCKHVGSSRCLMVHYEQLVLHPSESMHKILEFLDVPWNDSVLHHEDHINKPGGVSLSK